MKNILIDKNGDYGLEYTNAVWTSDQMHQDYHTAKVPLADADFLLEDEKFIMIVEYKNANTRKARDAGFKTPQFNPMDDKKFASIVRFNKMVEDALSVGIDLIIIKSVSQKPFRRRQESLLMYRGTTYRNACMFFIPFLDKSEYTFPVNEVKDSLSKITTDK